MRYTIMLLGGLLLQTLSSHAQKKQAVVISGHIQQEHATDTIQLIIRGEFSNDGDAAYTPLKNETVITKNGRFSFTLHEIEHPVEADLYINPQHHPVNNVLLSENQLKFVLVEPGDRIHVTGKKGALSFTGEGAAKWAYKQSRDSLVSKNDDMKPAYWRADKTFDMDRYRADCHRMQAGLLESFRNRLSAAAWAIFDADVRTGPLFYYLTQARAMTYDDTTYARKGKQVYEQYVRNMPVDTANGAILRWSGYAHYMRRKLSLDYDYARLTGGLKDTAFYEYLARRYNGILAEKTLMLQMDLDIQLNRISDEILAFMEAHIKTPVYRERIKMMKDTYATGSEVIDFEFRDKNDKIVRISDFKGKVVLMDMWFTGCGGCVAVAENLPAVEEKFKNNDNVVFISLSIDRQKDRWLKSVDPLIKIKAGISYEYTHYTTPTTVYLYTGGSGSYNPFIRKYVPNGAFPHLLLIGKDGKVFAADPPNPAEKDGQQKLTDLIQKAL